MVLFWTPIPYIENVRRVAAIKSEMKQLKQINGMICEIENKQK